MPGNASDYLETVRINWLRGVNTTPPAAIYLALFTSAPDDTAGSGTEVTGGAYARQVFTLTAPTSPPGPVTNAADITFPEASAGYTVTGVAIMDASTAGNRLFTKPHTVTPVSIAQRFVVPAGSLSLTED